MLKNLFSDLVSALPAASSPKRFQRRRGPQYCSRLTAGGPPRVCVTVCALCVCVRVCRRVEARAYIRNAFSLAAPHLALPSSRTIRGREGQIHNSTQTGGERRGRALRPSASWRRERVGAR